MPANLTTLAHFSVSSARSPLLAHCHLGLGRIYRRTGKYVDAREHLTYATTMYREMTMRFWLAQSEMETCQLA